MITAKHCYPRPRLPRSILLLQESRDLYEYFESKWLDEISYLSYAESERLDRAAKRARARYERRCRQLTAFDTVFEDERAA